MDSRCKKGPFLNLPELKQEILEHKVRPLYVFIGEELALQDLYIQKISEISGLEKVRVDSLKSIYNRISAKTLIKTTPKIYITRDDEAYYKEEKVWSNLIQGKTQKQNIIILLYTNIDKRSKFCKEHETVLTEFELIAPSLLKNRLQAITKMPVQYCEDIVKLCGGNYGCIQHELYKLSMFAKINSCSLNTAYLEFKKQNLIHEYIGDIIFDFTNAVVERNSKLAYSLLAKLQKTDEGTIKVLSVLYTNFRNMLIVQSTNQNERNEQVLGLSSGIIYMTGKKCGKYTLSELVNILRLLQSIESGIKTGKVDESIALDYFLAMII